MFADEPRQKNDDDFDCLEPESESGINEKRSIMQIKYISKMRSVQSKARQSCYLRIHFYLVHCSAIEFPSLAER